MVSVDVRIELKCDKCKKVMSNHYPITDPEVFLDDEINNLAELNDAEVDGDSVICEDCR